MLLRLTTDELSCVSLTGIIRPCPAVCPKPWGISEVWRGEEGPRLPCPGLVTGGTGILGLWGRTLSVSAMIFRTAPGDSVPARKERSQPYRVGRQPCKVQHSDTKTQTDESRQHNIHSSWDYLYDWWYSYTRPQQQEDPPFTSLLFISTNDLWLKKLLSYIFNGYYQIITKLLYMKMWRIFLGVWKKYSELNEVVDFVLKAWKVYKLPFIAIK